MSSSYELDLIVLVADKSQSETIEALLSRRHHSLGISQSLSYKVLIHPRRDPGCFLASVPVLQPFVEIARYALVVFDLEGSGQEGRSRNEVQDDLADRLSQEGWRNRVSVLAIDPELEVWVWSDSPHVSSVLGWEGQDPDLRTWLFANNLWLENQVKPRRPKECMEKALRKVGVRYSSALFRQLAESVSLEKCQDSSFQELKAILVGWFGMG